MFAAEDRADNIGRQDSETKEPRRIGWNDALGFRNILESEASIHEKLIGDCVGADKKEVC